MATVQDRINSWRKSRVRGASQINNEVALEWYNRWLQLFQKELLEYIANQGQVTAVTLNTEAGRDIYALPFDFDIKHDGSSTFLTDFYSITQLRVAYETKKGYPAYRVCELISLADYNITPKGKSIGEPIINKRISKLTPRYTFINKFENNKIQTHIRIFPTPDKSITAGISLNFNYINKKITDASIDESMLGVPRYFLDAIEDYMTYRLVDIENPEIAGGYYQQFLTTLHNNIYWLNRDQRPVEEELADLSFYSHN